MECFPPSSVGVLFTLFSPFPHLDTKTRHSSKKLGGWRSKFPFPSFGCPTHPRRRGLPRQNGLTKLFPSPNSRRLHRLGTVPVAHPQMQNSARGAFGPGSLASSSLPIVPPLNGVKGGFCPRLAHVRGTVGSFDHDERDEHSAFDKGRQKR